MDCPAVDQPVLWCFLGTGPCLPSAEWASWWQALGSVLAVFAAIGVVAWQLFVSHRHSMSSARFVASGMLTVIGQIIGGVSSVAEFLEERVSGDNTTLNDPSAIAALISSLPFPSKDDLLSLDYALPDCAVSLLRATNSMHQIRSALEYMAKAAAAGIVYNGKPYVMLRALAVDAGAAFDSAQNVLDRFVPT